MCPPKRPSAFIARSRFTGLPEEREPKEVLLNVSGVTSAQKDESEISVTVRHTPFTATLSPQESSFAKEQFNSRTREDPF